MTDRRRPALPCGPRPRRRRVRPGAGRADPATGQPLGLGRRGHAGADADRPDPGPVVRPAHATAQPDVLRLSRARGRHPVVDRPAVLDLGVQPGRLEPHDAPEPGPRLRGLRARPHPGRLAAPAHPRRGHRRGGAPRADAQSGAAGRSLGLAVVIRSLVGRGDRPAAGHPRRDRRPPRVTLGADRRPDLRHGRSARFRPRHRGLAGRPRGGRDDLPDRPDRHPDAGGPGRPRRGGPPPRPLRPRQPLVVAPGLPGARRRRDAHPARADGRAIVAAINVDTKPWFRPPFGGIDDQIPAVVGSAGWSYVVLWDIDTIDWRPESDGGPTADESWPRSSSGPRAARSCSCTWAGSTPSMRCRASSAGCGPRASGRSP